MQRVKPIELLRWICVLPAAVIGGIAARYLGSIAGHLVIHGWGVESQSSIAFSIQLLAYAIAAATFALAGAFTSPRSRRITAVVLAIGETLLSLLTHVLSQRHPGTVNYLHFAAETAGAALAVAYGFYAENTRVHEESHALMRWANTKPRPLHAQQRRLAATRWRRITPTRARASEDGDSFYQLALCEPRKPDDLASYPAFTRPSSFISPATWMFSSERTAALISRQSPLSAWPVASWSNFRADSSHVNGRVANPG